MKNSKALLSILMVYVMIVVSIAPTFAVIAPEDSASGVSQAGKIDSVLVEKMASASENELIPVWVWMTDIDTDRLDAEIEAKTGISQQKLDTARADMGLDVSSITASTASANSSLLTYLEDTKEQRTKIANDTKIYFDAKKQLASRYYTTANTSKIRQLGVASNRITYKSELTPSFTAYMTKDEIISASTSNNVVEIGYYKESVEEHVDETSTQARSIEDETEPPTEYPTIDVSTLHTGVKEALHHDDALQKYNTTGEGITVLYLDGNYVLASQPKYDQIPNRNKVYNYAGGAVFPHTGPVPEQYDYDLSDHANACVAYLQAFAENVEVYVVAKNGCFGNYSELPDNHPDRINSYDDIETLITNKTIDLINSSTNEVAYPYSGSFSARWFDAIVATYNIPLIASAGNSNTVIGFAYPIAPSSGYNSIAVGAYDYSQNRMYDNFTYNPINDSDRVAYKPDLVVAMDGTGATSAGAPVVSAIVAMMMELDPSLKSQPHIIKAILMASCHEKALQSAVDNNAGLEQEEMTDGLTLKQGAGKVDALRALDIVNYKTYGYAVIHSVSNSVTLQPFYLNSNVYGNSNETYPLNVSIAWLRKNTQGSNNLSDNDVTVAKKREFNLSVSYLNQDTQTIKKSETVNSGKQLVFYDDPDLDKDYRIRIYRGANDDPDGRSAVCGYAYSVGNFEKILDKVEISGTTAIGKTLTVSAYTADGQPAVNSELRYQWYASDDGENWQSISGVTSSTYTITENNYKKYISCVVAQDYLNSPEIEVPLQTRVFRYGDVDEDGEISTTDAYMISQYITLQATLTPEQFLAADVDLDGYVTAMDSTIIQNYLSGTINQLPIENNG